MNTKALPIRRRLLSLLLFLPLLLYGQTDARIFRPVADLNDITTGEYVFAERSPETSTVHALSGEIASAGLADIALTLKDGTIIDPPATIVWKLEGTKDKFTLQNQQHHTYLSQNAEKRHTLTTATRKAHYTLLLNTQQQLLLRTPGNKTASYVHRQDGENHFTNTGINHAIAVFKLDTLPSALASHELTLVCSLQDQRRFRLSRGESLTLPALDDIGNFTFVGWTHTRLAHHTQAPSPLLLPQERYTPQRAAEKLYPLYRKPLDEQSVFMHVDRPTIGKNYLFVSSPHAGQAYLLDCRDNNITATPIAVTVEEGQSLIRGDFTTAVWTARNSLRPLHLTNGTHFLNLTLSVPELSSHPTDVASWDKDYGLRYKNDRNLALNSQKTKFRLNRKATKNDRLFVFEQIETHRYLYTTWPDLNVVIGKALYATLYHPAPLRIPDGIEAFIGHTDNHSLRLIPLTDIIPAGTPVILRSQAAGTFVFPLDTTQIVPSACSLNELQASEERIERHTVADDTEFDYFCLSKMREQVSFRKVETGIPAGKVFLRYRTDAQVNSFSLFPNNTPIGLSTPTHKGVSSVPLRDLSGQIVTHPIRGQIYLHGKQKYIHH